MKRKIFLEALQGKKTERPPFWFMRQAGRYLPEYREIRSQCPSFLDLCYNPALATEVTLQPIRRFGMDAAILFSDILVIPDALGQSVRFEEKKGPLLEPITSASLENLRLEKVSNHLQPVYQTVTNLREQLPDNVALIGFSGAPWTLACYMIQGHGNSQFEKAIGWVSEQPEALDQLFDILERAIVQYLSAQIRSGAEAIQLFDSWAGLLHGDAFDRYVIESTQRIVHALKLNHPDIPIIGFPRLAGPLYLDYVRQTQVNAVSLDQTVNPEWAAAHLQAHTALQGNLDPNYLLGDVQQMLDQATYIIDSMGQGPYVFNLGHGIMPTAPVEHVAALCEFLRQFRYL